MTNEKRNHLLAELATLWSIHPFFISTDTRWTVHRGIFGIDVRVGIRPSTKSLTNRRTASTTPFPMDHERFGGPVVVFANLTDEEKDLICQIMCGVSDKIGIKNPKLTKTKSTDNILEYKFR